MINRNIQMKKRNGNQWENLFPISLYENIFNIDGISLSNQMETLLTDLDSLSNQVKTNKTDISSLDTSTTNAINSFKQTINSNINSFKNEINTKFNKHVPEQIIYSKHYSDLQTAVNDSENKILFIEPKTHLINTPIELKSNSTIIAYGSTFKRNANINVMFINESDGTKGGYTASENIKIYGGTFDGSGGSYSDRSTMLAIGHAKNVLIKDAEFKNLNEWHMIELNAVQNGMIDHCFFTDYGTQTTGSEMVQIDLAKSTVHFPWFGPYDDTTCDNITIKNSIFYQGIRAIGTHAYTIGKEHTKITIIDNIINQMTEEAIYGMDWAFTKIERNHITNVFRGIHLMAKGRSVVNHSITNNYLSSNNQERSRAIQIEGIRDGHSVTSGNISNNKIRRFKSHGIGVDFSLRWVIDNNEITDNEGHSIIIFGANRVTISNNFGYNNHNDISVTQESDNVLVEGNNIQKMVTTNVPIRVFVTGNIISLSADLDTNNTIATNNVIGGVIQP